MKGAICMNVSMYQSYGQQTRKLVTQNLLTSASLFERQPNAKMSLDSLEDLVALIDAFCLYDKALVLNRAEGVQPRWPSDVFGLFDDEQFLQIASPTASEVDRIIDCANGHLAAFLGEDSNTDRFKDLLPSALSPGESGFLNYTLSAIPDNPSAIEAAKEWFAQNPTRNSVMELLRMEKLGHTRSLLFATRSFLYFGYADAMKVDFTPDAARRQVYNELIDNETHVARQLLKAIRSALPPEKFAPPYFDLRQRVTPFAAIVFGRAKNQYRIVPEMQRLRRELRDVRVDLASHEESIRTADSWQEERKALDRRDEFIRRVAGEFGTTESEGYQVLIVPLLSISLAAIAQITADLMLPPGQSWINAIASSAMPALIGTLPILIEILKGQTSVDLHSIPRIARDIPSSAELSAGVKHLFDLSL